MTSVSEVKSEEIEAVNVKKVEADLEDAEPLRMRRRKRRKRKSIDDLDEFVVGEDFVGLEDLDYDVGGEQGTSRRRKGRSKSAEDAQPESGSSSGEKQCVDCGVVLACATKKDKQRYRDHMVVHEREKFTCDCEFADTDRQRIVN